MSHHTLDHKAFDKLLAAELPDVAARLDAEDRALLHIEMAAVARATRHAITSGDHATETRHFALLERVFAQAAPDVENAIYVSYLENVFLGETNAMFLAARGRLPPLLAKALIALENY